MMYYNSVKVYSVVLLLLCVLSSCSSNDDSIDEDPFYTNALTSASTNNLKGIWSIFQGEFNGQNVNVPSNFPECGRDFFIFSENGTYKEYLFQSSPDCTTINNDLDWTLNNGIIDLTNLNGQSEELVVVELTSDKLIFRTRFDVDEDGKLDILTLTARRYEVPKEVDIYSDSFQHDLIEPHFDKIRFSWISYKGFNNFDRYEIYRSNDGCNKANAELIASITDINKEFFVDENPPAKEELCYFLRIYTDQGFLGESELYAVTTNYLQVAVIEVSEPLIVDNTIELNWAKYQGNYFSHYEVIVQNYTSGFIGSGFQDEQVATIDNIETTNFTDSNPPYVLNPVYSVLVYDIFGNKSVLIDGQNSLTVNYERPEIFKLENIRFSAFDKEETILYVFGKSSIDGGSNIQRFNYSTNIIESVASKLPNLSTDVEMKVIQSATGKELIYNQGDRFYVYDAMNLKYKYDLGIDRVSSFDDFIYLGNDLWAFVDSDNIYTCTRDNASLTLVDQEPHFSVHQGNYNYQLIKLNDNQIIIGHFNEVNSLKFSFDNTGQLAGRSIIDIPFKTKQHKNIILIAHKIIL